MERHRCRGDAERLPGEPHPVCARCSAALALGAVVEAGLHPKPGAVTPCSPHRDKGFTDFAVHGVALARGLLEACLAVGGDPVEFGLRAYAEALRDLPLPPSNVGLGEALLLVPLAAAAGRTGCGDPGLLAAEASTLARAAGPGAARVYYGLLEILSPGHLGRYEGGIPGVGDGVPPDMISVLEAARWDHVHRELLEGYPLTLEVLEVLGELLSRGWSLGEAALEALLELLAGHGDTLIAAKWGLRAYETAIHEARLALSLYKRGSLSLHAAIEWLDGLWRPRGWSPGAALDILAAALGLLLAAHA